MLKQTTLTWCHFGFYFGKMLYRKRILRRSHMCLEINVYYLYSELVQIYSTSDSESDTFKGIHYQIFSQKSNQKWVSTCFIYVDIVMVNTRRPPKTESLLSTYTVYLPQLDVFCEKCSNRGIFINYLTEFISQKNCSN